MAVLLVIAEHLFGFPHGGFIGVDVFFVISGFLITGLLLREHQRTGRISFVDFYRRRTKRILPAATLVLLVTVAVSAYLYPAAKARSIGDDALWSFFFVGNYRFASSETDYFAATTGASPLQHYWSLSVEEQFYFVWPWLMLGLLAVLAWAGHGRYSRRAAAVLMGTVVVASFAWALWETSQRATWAYFSTPSRVWELGVGALLAIVAPRLRNLGPRMGAALSWLGLAVIAGAAFYLTPTQGFPAPAAALPVLGSALVLAAGIGREPAYSPLTNRVIGYIGDLSFSLYLWHFPIIVLMASVVPPGSKVYVASVLTLTAITSVAAYHGVEKPLHHARWFSSRQPRRDGTFTGAVAIVAAGVLASTAVVAGAWWLRPPPPPLTGQDRLEAMVDAEPDGTALGAWRQDLASALLAREWPPLDPSIDELGRNDLVSAWVEDGCLSFEEGASADWTANAERCIYGNPDGSRTLVLYGDSTGLSWLPAILGALDDSWRVQVWTARQCPVADLEVTETDGSDFGRCAQYRADARAAIDQEQPDALIVAGQGDRRQVPGAPDLDTADATIAEALRATAPQIAELSGTVVYLPPPPPGPVLSECATATSTPADCVGPDHGAGAWYEAMAASADATGATFIDDRQWFCIDRAGCPAFADGLPLLADGAHLTQQASEALAPVLAESLAPALPGVVLLSSPNAKEPPPP